jgi:hypothetical protein
MSRTRNARAMRMIGLAALAGLRQYHAAEPDPANPPAGGGGGAKPPEPKKLELTEEELAQRVASALKAERDKDAEAARKKQEEADRKKAEEEGKWKELADAEKAKSAELAAENRRLRITNDLRDYLATKHPEYAGVAKYILPQIPADTKDADLKAAIEKAAADYVKDNPRETKGSAAPAAPGRTTAKPNNGKPVNRMAGLESSI